MSPLSLLRVTFLLMSVANTVPPGLLLALAVPRSVMLPLVVVMALLLLTLSPAPAL